MKKFLVGLTMAFVFAVNLNPVWADDGNKVSVTLSSEVKSDYVIGNGKNIYDGPVWENDLFVGLPHGFYVDVWYLTGIDENGDGNDVDTCYGSEDEIDYTLGWAGSIAKGLDLDLGLSYFDLARIWSGDEGDLVVPYSKLTIPLSYRQQHSIDPYVKAEYYIPTQDDGGMDAGLRFIAGVDHNWKITSVATLSQRFNVNHDEGACGNAPVTIGQYKFSLTWTVYGPVSVNSFVLISSPWSSAEDGQKTEIVPGAGISFSF